MLIVEALQHLPNVELEVYSHTSCGTDGRDCLVRYLFGKRNPYRFAIGDYGSCGANNYDHQAIRTAAQLFVQNTSFANRLLLVLSDGLPNGYLYHGQRPINETREVISQLRRQRLQVVNIAIDDYHSEQIFGKSYVLKFTDLAELAGNMRKLFTRLLLK